MNGNLGTTLQSWPAHMHGWRKTETTPNSKVRPTYWHVKQKHLSYRSSNGQPPSPHHMGEAKDLLREVFGLSAGQVAHSGQSSWWTPTFTSYFHCFHQPSCVLKYKRHRLCLVEYKDLSATAKMNKHLDDAHFPQLGVYNKVRGHKEKEIKGGVLHPKQTGLMSGEWFVCVLAYCCLHWCKCACLKTKRPFQLFSTW